jgi:hypothetical protein
MQLSKVKIALSLAKGKVKKEIINEALLEVESAEKSDNNDRVQSLCEACYNVECPMKGDRFNQFIERCKQYRP